MEISFNRLPQVQNSVIGINSNQEKVGTTLVNLITWPEGFKFIDCRLHVAQQRLLYELTT